MAVPKYHELMLPILEFSKDGQEKRTCKTSGCNHSETQTTKKTGHNLGDPVVYKEATCTDKGEKRRYCKNIDKNTNTKCNHYEPEEIPAIGGEHDWNGRCGVIHDISGCSEKTKKITTHKISGGYLYSTKIECYLCTRCGAPMNGWSTEVDKKGMNFSAGRICREHVHKVKDEDGNYLTDKDGNPITKKEEDHAWESNTIVKVH